MIAVFVGVGLLLIVLISALALLGWISGADIFYDFAFGFGCLFCLNFFVSFGYLAVWIISKGL